MLICAKKKPEESLKVYRIYAECKIYKVDKTNIQTLMVLYVY